MSADCIGYESWVTLSCPMPNIAVLKARNVLFYTLTVRFRSTFSSQIVVPHTIGKPSFAAVNFLRNTH
jgi:hypothetical protein